MNKKHYDLVVLGSGPGGYVAAVKAARSGLGSVALLEKESPGGVCLNWGCIPSKSLIHLAGIFESRKVLEKLGVKVDVSGLDYGIVYRESRKAPDMLSRGLNYLFKKNEVHYFSGHFSFSAPYELVDEKGTVVSGTNIIIATGAQTKILPGIILDEEKILSSRGALNLKVLPKKALIVGSGAIGLEFAYIWSAFGVEVTLIESMNSILFKEDQESARVLIKSLEKNGVAFHVNVQIKKLQRQGKSVNAVFETSGKTVDSDFDQVLLAIGRTPNLDFKPEIMGIEIENNGVGVDSCFQTNIPRIYAIGDVTNQMQLAHVASRQADIVVAHLLGKKGKPLNYRKVPRCVYARPEIAAFGDTEEELKVTGQSYGKVFFPYRANGKALAVQKNEGFIKILFKEETKEILGVSIVGAEATELIHAILERIEGEKAIYGHPTMSEGVFEALEGIHGNFVHL